MRRGGPPPHGSDDRVSDPPGSRDDRGGSLPARSGDPVCRGPSSVRLGPALGGKYLTFSVKSSDAVLGPDCGRRWRRTSRANSSSHTAHCAVCDEPIRMLRPCPSRAQQGPRLQDWAIADAAAEHQLAVAAVRGPAGVDIGAGSAQWMQSVLLRRQDHVALRDTTV